MLDGFLNSSFENVTSATFFAMCSFGRQLMTSCKFQLHVMLKGVRAEVLQLRLSCSDITDLCIPVNTVQWRREIILSALKN